MSSIEWERLNTPKREDVANVIEKFRSLPSMSRVLQSQTIFRKPGFETGVEHNFAGWYGVALEKRGEVFEGEEIFSNFFEDMLAVDMGFSDKETMLTWLDGVADLWGNCRGHLVFTESYSFMNDVGQDWKPVWDVTDIVDHLERFLDNLPGEGETLKDAIKRASTSYKRYKKQVESK